MSRDMYTGAGYSSGEDPAAGSVSAASGFVTAVLLALMIAGVIIVAPLLEKRLFQSTILLLLGIGSVIIIRNNRRLLMWLVVFSTVFAHFNLYLGLQLSESFFNTYGYAIQLYTLPLVLLYLRWIAEIVQGKSRFSMTGVALLPLLFYVGFSIFSITQSRYPDYTGFELFALAQSVMAYLYLANNIRLKRDIFIMATALAAAVGLEAFLAVAQYGTGSTLGLEFFGERSATDEFFRGTIVRRSSGTLGHPNRLAVFLELFLPALIGLFLAAKQSRTKWILGGIVFLAVPALIFTVSRGGIFSGFLAILFLLFYWGVRKKKMVLVIALLLLAASAVGVSILVPDSPIATRLFSISDKSIDTRFPMNNVALRIIQHNTTFGIGLNTYAQVAPLYDYTPERIAVRYPLPVHNTYLLLLAEIGIFGFVAWLVFVAATLWKGFRLRGDPDDTIALFCVGLTAGIAAYMIHLLVDFNYISNTFVFWIACGLLTGIFQYTRRYRRQEEAMEADRGQRTGTATRGST